MSEYPNENIEKFPILREDTLANEIIPNSVPEALSNNVTLSLNECDVNKESSDSKAEINELLHESQVENDRQNRFQKVQTSDNIEIKNDLNEINQQGVNEPLISPTKYSSVEIEKEDGVIEKSVEHPIMQSFANENFRVTEVESNAISMEDQKLESVQILKKEKLGKNQRKDEIDDFLKKINEEDAEIEYYSSDDQNIDESDSGSFDTNTGSEEETSGDESGDDDELDSNEDIKDDGGDDIDLEEEDNNSGPITSKNELPEPAAPSIPDNLQINEKTEISLLGHIFSFSENNLIIKGIASAEYRVIKENVVLCFENRSPIGVIFEIFGPLKNPFYRVKFNSDIESNLNTYKDRKGTKVFYITSGAEFELTNKIMASKGCDASNANDEEVSENEAEFSDDAEESEFKKSKKKRKRNQNKLKNNNGNEKGMNKSNSSEENQSHGLPSLPKNGNKKKLSNPTGENNGFTVHNKNFQKLPVPPTVTGNSSFMPNSTSSFKNFLNGGMNNIIKKENGAGLSKNINHNMNFRNQNFGMNNFNVANNGSGNAFYHGSFNYDNEKITQQRPNFNNNPINGAINNQTISNIANTGQNLNQVAQMIELALQMKQQESPGNSYSNHNNSYNINGNNQFHNNSGFDPNMSSNFGNPSNFNSRMNKGFSPNVSNNYNSNMSNNFNPNANNNFNSNMNNNNFNSNMNNNFNSNMNNNNFNSNMNSKFNPNMNNNFNPRMNSNFNPNMNNNNNPNINNFNPNMSDEFNSNNGFYNGNGGFNGGANY